MKWLQRLGLTAQTKRSAVGFLCASFLLTALIGASLSSLEFKPGMPLPSFQEGTIRAAAPEETPLSMKASSFAGILALIFVGVFLLILIIQVVRGIEWKKLISSLLSLFWKVAVAISLFLLIVALLPKTPAAPEATPPLPTPKPPVTAPLGAAPSLLLWLSGLAILALAVILGARMIAERHKPTADRWEEAAEQALQAIRKGENVRKVILECYRRMSRALQEEQNLERKSYMTTGEFEHLLATKGIPLAPVHRLTALFDEVRYGRGMPTLSEEQDAMQSLEAILTYSRESRAD